MIPEPDYSESEDDAYSETETEVSCSSDASAVVERFRELSEIHVHAANVQTKPAARSAPKEGVPKTKPPVRGQTKANRPADKTKVQVKPQSTATTPKSAAKPSPKSPVSKNIEKSGTQAKAAPVASIKPTARYQKSEAYELREEKKEVKYSKTTKGKPKSPELVSGTDFNAEHELIKPKKPVNPYLESSERLKLHKELKFSQKYGMLGPAPKTELQLALERYTKNKMQKESLVVEKTSLEKILAFQAKKIEMQEQGDAPDASCAWMKRLQRPPPSDASPPDDEFYQVHARVVASSSLTRCFLPDAEQDLSPPRTYHSDDGSEG